MEPPIKYAGGSWNLHGTELFSLSTPSLWNNSILSVDQIMNQSQKTNNTRLASRKEMRVTWLPAPVTGSGNILNAKIELFLGWSQHWMWYWWWGWLLDRRSTWLQVFILILPCLNISPASQGSHEENKYIYNETSVQPSSAQQEDFSSPSQPDRIISSELIKVWRRHSHRWEIRAALSV